MKSLFIVPIMIMSILFNGCSNQLAIVQSQLTQSQHNNALLKREISVKDSIYRVNHNDYYETYKGYEAELLKSHRLQIKTLNNNYTRIIQVLRDSITFIDSINAYYMNKYDTLQIKYSAKLDSITDTVTIVDTVIDTIFTEIKRYDKYGNVDGNGAYDEDGFRLFETDTIYKTTNSCTFNIDKQMEYNTKLKVSVYSTNGMAYLYWYSYDVYVNANSGAILSITSGIDMECLWAEKTSGSSTFESSRDDNYISDFWDRRSSGLDYKYLSKSDLINGEVQSFTIGTRIYKIYLAD